MNIQDPMSADNSIQAPQQDSATEPTTKKDKDKDKDSKSFSKVLAEKNNKSAAAKADAPPTGQPQSFRDTAPVAQQSRPVAPASLPPAMQNLVQEITVATGPQNRSQVDIQLNSKTFDGLKISISHADGNVSIQMLSRTPEVAAVLNRNLDQLSQALEARGVPVVSIKVQTVKAPAPPARDPRGGKRS
jgi:flagellar hook-length control protein FliK